MPIYQQNVDRVSDSKAGGDRPVARAKRTIPKLSPAQVALYSGLSNSTGFSVEDAERTFKGRLLPFPY